MFIFFTCMTNSFHLFVSINKDLHDSNKSYKSYFIRLLLRKYRIHCRKCLKQTVFNALHFKIGIAKINVKMINFGFVIFKNKEEIVKSVFEK